MASIKIILREKTTKEGLFPVVLRIIKDRKTKLISLGMECIKKDWDEANSQFKKNHANYLQRNRVLLNIKVKALKIIDEFNLQEIDFTLTQFEEKFRGKSIINISVIDFWNKKISDLILAGRIGNAKAYNETKKSFFKFSKNKQMQFRDITHSLLDKYETYLRANKNEDGGISVKMRQLRAVYNDAIKNELVDGKYYPFKVYKISKLKKSNNKRALMRSEVKLIEELDENKHPQLLEAKKLFVFSYYARGINFHDIMKLRWSNIEGDKIVYIRSKTKGKFAVKILKPVEEILNYYKNLHTTTNYIFPILLKEGLTPVQIDNRKTAKLKKFNKDLKEIALVVGINKPLTSYVARHSFATNLKEKGVSTDIISQSMGHRDIGITTVYLKDFDDDIIDDANEKLLQEESGNYNQLRFAV